jgi:cytochrome P450
VTTTLLAPAAIPGPPAELVAQRLGGQDLAGVPDFLCEVAELYGPIVSLDLPHKRHYLVSDPEGIREVLVSKAGSFRKGRGTDALHQVLGDALFTSEPPAHTAQRRLVQPAFHHRYLTGIGRVMVEQTEALCAQWTQDGVVDVGRAMRRLALRIGGITLFSHAFDDQEDRVGSALTEVMSHAASGIFGRLSERFTSERIRRFHAARAAASASPLPGWRGRSCSLSLPAASR